MGRKLILVLVIALAAALPLVVQSKYSLRLCNLALIFSLLAISLNIILGYAGQIALGHAALFGIGAYTSALLTAGGSGVLFWPAFVAAGIITGLAGLFLGIPTLRLKGHYLALATLGFGEIMRLIFFNWREVTHGMDGISGIPAPAIGSLTVNTDFKFYYLCLLAVGSAVVLSRRIESSKYGWMLAAIRDAELGAGSAGVNVPRLKVIAFGISAVLAGFAGSLYAHLVSYISPDVFVFDVTAQLLSMVLIGGIGTTFGPVLGAVVLTFMPELLRISKAYYQLIYGAGIAAMIIFLPAGLLGLARFAIRRKSMADRVETAAPPPPSRVQTQRVRAAASDLSPAQADSILEVSHLSCRFGGLVAIDDVRLSVKRGAIHALIGPNGSGKSTFINLATGIYKPNSGAMTFAGHSLAGLPPWRIADLGLVRTFQNLQLFRSLSVKENVLVSCRSLSDAGWAGALLSTPKARVEMRDLETRAEEALRFTGMWHLRDHSVRTLPHEQQRVVEIARALAINPKLIMLDEPAAGMNPADAARLIDLIYRMRERGITILLIEHNMPLVMRVADQVTVFNFGRKIAEGNPDTVRSDPEVVTAYLGKRLSRRLGQHAVA
jgi:branched-chain amino acid transport system permease protein